MSLTLRLRNYGRLLRDLEQVDNDLRNVDNEIMVQHETIFEWLASDAEQTAKGNPYD